MRKERLDPMWLFWKEGQEENKRVVRVPHDAMLTEERDPNLENGSASGFYPGGRYYYQKELNVQKRDLAETWILEFEGIYMDSRVYLNGELVGQQCYGYTNFFVPLQGRIREGKNELLVIADNSKTPNSRWYSGSGIYRPVNLYRGGKNYIVPDGVRILTKSLYPAELSIQAELCIKPEQKVAIQVWDGETLVAAKEPVHSNYDLGTLIVENAMLWSHENPKLYQVVIQILAEDQVVDSVAIPYGIRTLSWDARKGFCVNGQTVKFKGGCLHHDNGPLGAATNDKAEYRKIRKMKELGYNAIRYSHNPAGKNFLDICDKLGMYVIDESFDQWKVPQSTYDYALHFDEEWEGDLTALVRKDINHPCVIMYGIGNEITDTGLPFGGAIAKMLCEKIKEYDASRPTFIAINSMLSVLAKKRFEKKLAEAQMTEEERKKKQQENVGSKEVNDLVASLPQIMASITPEMLENLIRETAEAVDIVGYNYGENLFEGTHRMVPERVILSSETFPSKIGEHWPLIMEQKYLIGDFMWTAWDYLGEAGVGLPFYGSEKAPFSKPYPCLTAGCGSIDLTGYVESQGKYTSVIFGKEKNPCIAVRPVNHAGEAFSVGMWRLTDAIDSWSWHGWEGRSAEVEVYSIGAEVELWQTIGEQKPQLVGRKTLEQCRAFFRVAYEKGSLLAISFDDHGEAIGRSELFSAEEEQLQLFVQPEETHVKADGEDLLYVNIFIADSAGNVAVQKDCKIKVSVEGSGELIALASGNPETREHFGDSVYTSYHGRLLAVIRPAEEAGEIRITSQAEDMEVASATVQAI